MKYHKKIYIFKTDLYFLSWNESSELGAFLEQIKVNPYKSIHLLFSP